MKENMKTVIHLLKQQNEQLNRMGQNIDELNNKVDELNNEVKGLKIRLSNTGNTSIGYTYIR